MEKEVLLLQKKHRAECDEIMNRIVKMGNDAFSLGMKAGIVLERERALKEREKTDVK